MSKTTIPEPVGYLYQTGKFRTVDLKLFEDIPYNTTVKGVITTTQAEAYAAEKVREALVQAESILRGNAKACKSLAVKVLLSANADAIGELIPPLPGPVEPTT